MKTIDLEPLKTDYDHPNAASLIGALRMVLEMYAQQTRWRRSTGDPPHHLREGMRLDFHPSNVVHGWEFAEEAIEKIDKYLASCPTKAEKPAEVWGVRDEILDSVGKQIVHMALPEFPDEEDCDLGFGEVKCKDIQQLRLSVERTIQGIFNKSERKQELIS